MPSSARKSSIGATRRGLQKAHIPYRGDNPQVGKKTGIAVQQIERKSDGFEPFEELLQQADNKTPPRRSVKKRKKSIAVPRDEYDEEDGEMDMELDDSPMQYFANARQPSSPSERRLTNGSYHSSSRANISRASDVDFDSIPSPRARTSASMRKSLGFPRSSSAGPSHLSRAYSAEDMDVDSDPLQTGARDQSPEIIPEGPSFSRMAQDEDEDDDDDSVGGGPDFDYGAPMDDLDDMPPPLPEEDEGEQEESPQSAKRSSQQSRKRGVLSDVPEEGESDVEDEIARGLSQVDDQEFSDDENRRMDDEPEEEQEESPEPEPEPEPERKKKKAKIEAPLPKPPRNTQSRSKKENRPVREGVRKSKRKAYAPLEWWRGEKVVYGRKSKYAAPSSPQNSDDENPDADSSGPIRCAPIAKIVRIPKEEPEPLGAAGRKARRNRARSKSAAPRSKEVVVYDNNPEEGWDDETQQHVVVLDFTTKDEVQRRIAMTHKSLDLRPTAGGSWSFQKVFGDADFFAAGMLSIPPKSRKDTKVTKDNTYVFYVVEGAVNLKIHETSLVLATGAMFMVPRGNSYFIENICDRDAKIFFTQARKVASDDPEALPSQPQALQPPLSVPSANSNGRRDSGDVKGKGKERAPTRSSSAAAVAEGSGKGRGLSKVPAQKRAQSTRA